MKKYTRHAEQINSSGQNEYLLEYTTDLNDYRVHVADLLFEQFIPEILKEVEKLPKGSAKVSDPIQDYTILEGFMENHFDKMNLRIKDSLRKIAESDID